MGCGKSHIGKKLATKTGAQFVDLDTEIERKENQSISEIFKNKGEIYFRKSETQVLKRLLEQQKSFVLALGGGTPCYGQNLELIKSGDCQSFYLKLSVKSLTQRLWEEKGKRPLINTIKTERKLEEFIQKHLFERRFYYMQSDFNIDMETYSTEEEILNQIIKQQSI